MTRKITTKLLAVLAVTALALVPAFALIDSTDSSGTGEHDVDVKNWDEFKAAMNDARAAPEDTFNVNMATNDGNITVKESITIPANVNLKIVDNNMLALYFTESGKTTMINEGSIMLEPRENPFGQAGGIVGSGAGIMFINRGTITAEANSSIMFVEGANFINDGSITSKMWNFNFIRSSLTNNGDIELVDSFSSLLIQLKGAQLVNWGSISGGGGVIIENASTAVNLGTVSCRVLGEMQHESAVWDTSKAGKTISSEGYKLSVSDSVIGGTGSATISDVTMSLELASNYAEAEYINNMTLRTAFFKVNSEMRVQGKITAQLPDAGTYSFNDTPATSEKTVSFDSTVRLEGLLRINAYFDASEMLQRVDIIFGVGLNTSTDVDFRMNINDADKKYDISYDRSNYEFGMGLNIAIGLDFSGFDLLAHNPGDQWTIEGTIKVADADGHIDITANGNTVQLLEYNVLGEQTETDEKMIRELRDSGRTTVDLDELFDVLFGTGGAVGAPVASSGAAMAPVNASAATPAVNGLFDSFIFTATATMGEDGYVTLTRGPASAGAIDIGEIIFDALGDEPLEVNSEVSGDSMTTLFTGTLAMITGSSQEDINSVLSDLGANYTESNMSVSDMDRICDLTMRNIDKMGGRDDSNNTSLYVVIGLISALAVIIAIPMFIRKK